MTEGTKVIGKGPGIISGNLSYIGAFTHEEDALDYFDECYESIDKDVWDITEAKVVHMNERNVVRILAIKKQGELDFGE